MDHVRRHRLHKRQLPDGFTRSKVEITETMRNLHSTWLETQVVTVIVPVETTVAKTTKTPVKPTTTPATTPAQDTVPPKATSTPQTTSSVPSSSSTSTTSSTPSTSATPSTPPPAPVSQPSSTPATSPAVPSPPVVPSSDSASPTPSANNNASLSSASSSSKGLPSGAIGGIVAAAVIVAIAILLFVVRRSFLARRKSKRATWNSGMFPKPSKRSMDFSERSLPIPAPISEKPLPPSAQWNTTPVHDAFASSRPAASPQVLVTALPPPPASYNNPMPPPPVINSVQVPGKVASFAPALAPVAPIAPAAEKLAYVRCTYVPTLPDELSISTGEMVRVLAEYDDGWGLCMNTRGEQGVVPLECLDRGNAMMMPSGYLGQGMGDWRLSKRASSLYAAGQAPAMGGPVRY